VIQAFQIKLALSFISFALIIDLYSWQAVKALVRDKSNITKKIFAYIYWTIPVLVFIYFMSGLLFRVKFGIIL
jgi:hypothetical protein